MDQRCSGYERPNDGQRQFEKQGLVVRQQLMGVWVLQVYLRFLKRKEFPITSEIQTSPSVPSISTQVASCRLVSSKTKKAKRRLFFLSTSRRVKAVKRTIHGRRMKSFSLLSLSILTDLILHSPSRSSSRFSMSKEAVFSPIPILINYPRNRHILNNSQSKQGSVADHNSCTQPNANPILAIIQDDLQNQNHLCNCTIHIPRQIIQRMQEIMATNGSKRQIWLGISESILRAQEEYPEVKYIQEISATISSHISYLESKDIDHYLQKSQEVALCQLIYTGEAINDLQQRAVLLVNLSCRDEEAFILGFCRLYDVFLHFFGMYTGMEFELISGNVSLEVMQQHTQILLETLVSLMQINTKNMVSNFESMMSIHFRRFREIINARDGVMLSDQKEKRPRKKSFATTVYTKVPFLYEEMKFEMCQRVMQSTSLYEHDSEYKVMRADAIEFCLIYMIRKQLKEQETIYLKDDLLDILNILENPCPNTKKYRALDPKSWNQYKERSKIYYEVVYNIIKEAISGTPLNRHESLKHSYIGYFLSYHDYRGFSIRYGEVSIVKKDKECLLMVNRLPPPQELPQGDVEIMIPGFINLHTHTKFSFQGNVNFGSIFSGRFEWRQAQFEGKHIIDVSKSLDKSPESQSEFKKYVKLYTQLQALIGGTTTIFQQSKYDLSEEYPDIIRSTVQSMTGDKEINVTSNDIYVLWRNEKQKNDLMLAWSRDYTNFVRSIIEVELEVLETFESKRTNLHVHLAEGRSKFAITTCEFDNFCEDIICMEHFLRHLKTVLRDKKMKFLKKFKIDCESKTQEQQGFNIINARSQDDNFFSFMTIMKHIQFTGDNHITTRVSAKIQYSYRESNGRSTPIRVEEISHSDLVQVYQIHTLRSNLLVVHGNGMDPLNQLHQYILKTYNVSICISPYSNISLYGGVDDFNWKELIVSPRHSKNMCISTDWSPTGKQNLIEEIRFMLKKLKEVNFDIDSELCQTLFKMITINPARIIKMPAGEIKDNFFADFWIGKFPSTFIAHEDHNVGVNMLIEYILREFPYQNDIKEIYSKGRKVYSNRSTVGLQEINLKHEKKRYFYNPDGDDNLDFQNYVRNTRELMVSKYKSPISLLFP